jgi:hypothetical protein
METRWIRILLLCGSLDRPADISNTQSGAQELETANEERFHGQRRIKQGERRLREVK